VTHGGVSQPDPPTLVGHFSTKTPISQKQKTKPKLQIPSSAINNPIRIFVSIFAINNPHGKHNGKTQPAVSSSSPTKPNRKTQIQPQNQILMPQNLFF
jgi:hypothetical protein